VLYSLEGLEEVLDAVVRHAIQSLCSLSPRAAARVTLAIENTTRRLFRLVDRLEEEDKQLRQRLSKA
jgi:hypothetical protein